MKKVPNRVAHDVACLRREGAIVEWASDCFGNLKFFLLHS